MTLLDTLQASLEAHPPPLSTAGTLRLHTLISTPRPVKSLYPLAHIHPLDLEVTRTTTPVSAYLEHVFVTASWTPSSPPSHSSPPQSGTDPDSSQTTLVYALEAFLYTLPEYGSAVLYISKLDSTGYGPAPLASRLRAGCAQHTLGPGRHYGATLTAQLSSAFVQHFSTFRHWHGSAVEVDHVSVHILARSQPAYLFPGSPENPGKKVLSDGGLIRWWRDVMSDAVVASRAAPVESRADRGKAEGEDEAQRIDARAFYLVPGYNRLESHILLPLPPQPSASTSSSSPPPSTVSRSKTREEILAEAGWVYGYPYSAEGACCAPNDLPPLPLHWQRSAFIHKRSAAAEQGEGKDKAVTDPKARGYDAKRVRCISTLMPHFSDDPKTRFMDELQRDAHEHAGWKKVDKQDQHEAVQPPSQPQIGEATASAPESAQLEPVAEVETAPKRSHDDVAPQGGEAGGEEREAKRGKPDSGSLGTATPLAVLRGQMRERRSLDDLSIDEFWLRMGFRQECCAGNAVGVVVCLFTRRRQQQQSEKATTGGVPTAQPLSLPHPTIQDLVFKNLMRDACEWNDVEQAKKLTMSWQRNVGRAVKRKGGWVQTVAKRVEGEAEAVRDEEVGEGVVWIDVRVGAPTVDVVRQVEKQVEKGLQSSEAQQGRRSANVLRVKKKKPAQT
ncbi:hypothetical protein ACQY0O_005403 [Thecaphora frezii]